MLRDAQSSIKHSHVSVQILEFAVVGVVLMQRLLDTALSFFGTITGFERVAEDALGQAEALGFGAGRCSLGSIQAFRVGRALSGLLPVCSQ